MMNPLIAFPLIRTKVVFRIQLTLSWEETSPDEHTLLSALAEGIDATGRSSLDLTTIETRLRNAGVSIPRPDLQGHIESLAQREVLGLTEAFHAQSTGALPPLGGA